LGEGSKVASTVILPKVTSLPSLKLTSGFDVAVNPANSSLVYVAYTEAVHVTTVERQYSYPILYVAESKNRGKNFNIVYSEQEASLPALAVAADGTVAMLYASSSGDELQINLLRIFGDNWNFNPKTNFKQDAVLAKFLDSDPQSKGDPYLGNYFQIRAVGNNFAGTFCASDDPQLDDFPSGVFFQRYVQIDNIGLKNNFQLLYHSGHLVSGPSGTTVPVSIDPFAFYDVAPEVGVLDAPLSLPPLPVVRHDVIARGDPYSGVTHMAWPGLPANEPPLQLYSSLALGEEANWAPATNSSILQTNGQNFALFGSSNQQFYRLRQDVAGGQFQLFAAAGNNGTLNPSGVLTNAGLGSQTFTANASNNYAVSAWYLDGVVVQSNGTSFTLTNISSEHTLLTTFVPSNDLAVAITEIPCGGQSPTETSTTNNYQIVIVNKGLNTLADITMADQLDSSTAFNSASISQGSITNYPGGFISANIGSLDPGSTATVDIQFLTLHATNIVDTVSVACSQTEPNLANNFATNVTQVIDPVSITSQPVSQTVSGGGTVSFTVGAAGTPPFNYQWYYNATNLLDNATNATLTLTNVSSSQAGTYSVSVTQIFSPEDITGESSEPATLIVQ
jgi:uncharacterized repeat protein (TIGR01451 family)